MRVVSGILICICFLFIGCNSKTSSKVKTDKQAEKLEQRTNEDAIQQSVTNQNKQTTQASQSQTIENSAQTNYIDKSKFIGKWEVITMTIHYTDNSNADTTFIPPKLMQYQFMKNEVCIITVAETRSSTPQNTTKYYKYFSDNTFDFFDVLQTSDGTGSYEIFELNDTSMIFRVCFGARCYIYDLKRI